jgi:pyridoxal phosphate enzyme (YggS family)
MANDAAKNLLTVLENCRRTEKQRGKREKEVVLIVVSKTFGEEEIRPVLEASHRVFGENRVQEAEAKWPKLKAEYDDIELHLIGPLQSNKAALAVALFDVIQTVDREKIAKAIASEMKAQNRNVRLLVQVNTGSEPQKAGVAPQETEQFVNRCRDEYGLEIEGLMCIPPAGENPGPHFALLRNIAEKLGLNSLSMGMSSDYQTAIELGATHVRVGSAIFGHR